MEPINNFIHTTQEGSLINLAYIVQLARLSYLHNIPKMVKLQNMEALATYNFKTTATVTTAITTTIIIKFIITFNNSRTTTNTKKVVLISNIINIIITTATKYSIQLV